MGAKFYFFTEPTLLAQQAADQAFGPVPAAPPPPAVPDGLDRFRITSLHTASSNPTAYAACDGIVCVQRVPGTALVTVILRPLVQPALNFAPIKYIVYKGILDGSLISGADAASAASNDLTNSLWTVQEKKNLSAHTPGATAPANALGVGLAAAVPAVSGDPFADAEPIDNLFYRLSGAFQLPVVKGGWSIGQFDKNGFGIEVLMEGLAFHHPLSLTRQIESKIAVPSLLGTENDAQKFDHWHAKEQVLGFMDPCAFYGSFFLAGIRARSGPSFVTKTGNALYQDLLLRFENRNKAYLDIRNEHNFSFNYFGNYGSTPSARGPIKLSYNPANLTDPAPIDYYAGNWPILTLAASNFPSANAAKARNAFRIQLPVGDNPEPLVYVSQGYRDINTKNNGFPTELKGTDRFFDTFLPSVGGYTATKNKSGQSSMAFVVPNVSGQGPATPVSCYTRLKYLKQLQGATTVSIAIQSANYLDNLIYPLDLRILFDGTAPIQTTVYDEEVYVNAQDVDGMKFDFIGKVGIARDLDNTSFFLVPTSIRKQPGQASALVTLSGETSDYAGNYPNLVALKYPLERVRKSELVFSATNKVPVAKFASDGTAEAQAKFKNPDFDKFFIFVVANGAFDSWQNKVAAAQGGGFRVYLGIKNLQTASDGVGVPYTSFDLVLRAFVLDGSAGQYNVQEIATDPLNAATNIKVYAHAGA